MSNFRKFISMGAIAVLGVTNMLTPLSYAAAADVNDYDAKANPISTAESFSFIMPHHDVYLKAYTEANHYFVRYNGNTSTSWSMQDSEFIYDQTWTLTQNAYEKLWYTFVDWNDQAGGGGTHYADKAKVKNLTTQENDTVDIHAQWTPNVYNITYDLNDSAGTSSWVHSKTPSSLAYDETWTINHPSRTWYTFTGWNISNMDSNPHVIWGQTTNATSATRETATKYVNLRATSGTVKFVAQWTANPNTAYKVEHYTEDLDGQNWTKVDTDNLNWTTDTVVKPSVHTYTWFTKTTNTPYSGNINADGSTVFRYEYTRNSYNLTLNAGRWVATVKWTGTVNTAGGSANAGQSTTISFKYDEPVKLAFTLKQWYKNWVWSGYSGTASEFKMPAKNAEKTAYAEPIVYTITYDTKSGTVIPANPTSYTVESGDIRLTNPDRYASKFAWWIGWVVNGEQLAGPTMTVTIASWSIWNRSYTATWTCLSWYHSNEAQTQCIPDADTEYHVKHYFQKLEWWNNWDLVDTTSQTWQTEAQTDAKPIAHEWFTVRTPITNDVITWNGSTTVSIRYERNSYTWIIANPAWVEAASISTTAEWAHPTGTDWTYKYGDTVTINATLETGYTFGGWTVKDASWNTVTVTNSGSLTNATFTMPANSVTITPTVTKVTYHITYELNNWSVATANPTSYDKETATFTLTNPTRDHSEFAWWSWTDISGTSGTVTIAKWSVWDRSYEATWRCHTWYHANANGQSCDANNYTVVIDYKDGGNGGGTRTGEVQLTYDQIKNIPEPQQSWYDFAWWTITWMSGWVTHTIWNTTTTNDTASGVHGTGFKNLTVEEDGVVTFTAVWTARNDTKYTVYHYYEDLNANTYSLSWTDNLEWRTDNTITLRDYIKNKTWFTYVGWLTWTNDPANPDIDRATLTTTINKDGSTKIYLYYQRFTWYVYLSGDEHIAWLSWTWRSEWTFDYGATVNVNARAGDWYHFKQWIKKTDATFATDGNGN